ncbi:unnamed protein product [Leptidea sinapis]|uniref:Uncharacterized protein n=1 Tax=Leptidea sinapis TaxID=189913 RepID=A0A5E4QQ87_9NEOP|nr:unnamed protein product [Leptidea sinapis]
MPICLSQNIVCLLAKSNIKDIYRVHGKINESKNPPIIVETGSTVLKTESLKYTSHHIWQDVKYYTQIKAILHTNYLSEHLTNKSHLGQFIIYIIIFINIVGLHMARYIRKDDQDPLINLRNEEQIHQLMIES